MPRYKNKPIIIEAVKITHPITIDTMEGKMKGNPGDYLITEPSGEQYPCSPELFEKMYVPVKDRINVKGFLRKSWRKVRLKTQEITQKK